jgi:hypothetical protein
VKYILKRLVPQQKIKRTAKVYTKPTMELNGFITKGGLYYGLSVRLLNHKLMYSILCYDMFETSSLYDGEDFEEAFEFFCELAMALQGIHYAENIANEKRMVQEKINKLVETSQDMSLKVKPLFLGDSDFIG